MLINEIGFVMVVNGVALKKPQAATGQAERVYDTLASPIRTAGNAHRRPGRLR